MIGAAILSLRCLFTFLILALVVGLPTLAILLLIPVPRGEDDHRLTIDE